MSLSKDFYRVKSRIQKSVNDHEMNTNVDLLAVSKRHHCDSIRQIFALGQKRFGESYVQEAVKKIEQLADLNIQWHFIGPIQSNKTKSLAVYFNWVQSVDSIKILNRLNKHRQGNANKLNVLLQLKVGSEETKRGFSKDELLSVCQQYKQFPHLNIRGLMSIPIASNDFSIQKQQFQKCHDVFELMKGILPADTLSIGMSGDLEAAIACGSTMVRIGTDIFGTRQTKENK